MFTMYIDTIPHFVMQNLPSFENLWKIPKTSGEIQDNIHYGCTASLHLMLDDNQLNFCSYFRIGGDPQLV